MNDDASLKKKNFIWVFSVVFLYYFYKLIFDVERKKSNDSTPGTSCHKNKKKSLWKKYHFPLKET
jgi:hypothetical protein